MKEDKYKAEMLETIKKLTAKGKGILAADESVTTLKSKFDKIGIETSDENRRAYRELLFTAPGIEESISGVILFQETVDQKTKDGRAFMEVLKKKDIVAGIKLDKGLVPLVAGSTESFTRGMDDLPERAAEFYKKGCRFAKWRCALRNDENHPTSLAIREVAYALARYANVCQANGLVPIVEPEMLTDGKWDLAKGELSSRAIFSAVFAALNQYNVCFETCLFKPHMVTTGSEGPKTTPQEIARATIDILKAVAPPALGGIFFLSGGQSEHEATVNLHEINKQAQKVGAPWKLSFSYGRALQNSVVDIWKGKADNVKAAQEMLKKRASFNGLAVEAQYVEENDKDGKDSNFQKDYSY